MRAEGVREACDGVPTSSTKMFTHRGLRGIRGRPESTRKPGKRRGAGTLTGWKLLPTSTRHLCCSVFDAGKGDWPGTVRKAS